MISMIFLRAPDDDEHGFPGIAVLGEEGNPATYLLYLFFDRFQGYGLMAQVTALYPDRADDRRDIDECSLPLDTETELTLIAEGGVAHTLLDAIYTHDKAEVALPNDDSPHWELYPFPATEEGPAHALCCLNAVQGAVLYPYLLIFYSRTQYRAFQQMLDPDGPLEDEMTQLLRIADLPESSDRGSVMVRGNLPRYVRCGLAELKRLQNADDAERVTQRVREVMALEGMDLLMLAHMPAGGGED